MSKLREIELVEQLERRDAYIKELEQKIEELERKGKK